MNRTLRRQLMLGVAGFLLPALPVYALPVGPTVAQGLMNSRQQAGSLNILQNSAYALIDWQSFDIAAGESVRFVQPDKNSVAVNRIWSNGASEIAGRLSANGQLYLLNPYGIIFKKSASVDAAGLVAAAMMQRTHDCRFSLCLENNDRGGAISNAGRIHVAQGGTLILAGKHVENSGILRADNGKATLVGAESLSLAMGADGQLHVASINGARTSRVDNSGLISVGSGVASLIARGGDISDVLVRASVNQSGVVEAQSLTARGGNIILEADEIRIGANARLDARGAYGGGNIFVGGGGKIAPDRQAALEIHMDQSAHIDASAVLRGDGGQIIVGAAPPAATQLHAHGTMRAQGGFMGGNGGFVETSGGTIDIAGLRVNASAPAGQAGLWLIDPTDYLIDATAAAAIIGDAQSGLNSGTNVEITTTNSSGIGATGAGSGDITVAASILKTTGSDATLTFRAERNIYVQSGVEIGSSSNKLNIQLLSDSDGSGGGAVQINNATLRSNGGDILISGGLDPMTGYASGNSALMIGIDLRRNAQILSSGGNIIMRGQGAAIAPTSSNDIMAGIAMTTTTSEAMLIDAGSGKISLTALGGGLSGSTQGWRQAVIINQHNSGAARGTVNLNSTSSANDAIYIDSTTISGTGTNRSGIDLRHGTTLSGNIQMLCDNCIFNGATSEGNVIFNLGNRNLTITPKATSFTVSPIISGSYSGNNWIGAASTFFAGVQFTNFKQMNNFTLGNSSSNTSITLDSAINMAGNFNLIGLTLNINAPITLTGAGSAILLRAKDNVITANGTSASPFILQTNNGNIVLHADSNSFNGGNIQIGDYNILNSANGATNQQTGGGNDNGRNGINTYDRNSNDGIPDFYAQGYVTANSLITAAGVYIGQQASFYSGGGNIFMAGRTPNATVGNVQAVGVYINSALMDAGAGKIQIWGRSSVTNNTANPYSHAIWLNANSLNQTTSLISGSSASDAILLVGDASSATTLGSSGIFTYQGANGDWGTRIVTTNGGGISLTGKGSTGSNATGNGEYGDGIDLNFTQILTKNGAISLNGTGGPLGISLGGRSAFGNVVQLGRLAGASVNGVSLANNSGAISLLANNFSLNRGNSSSFAANIATSGAVTFAPVSTSFSSFSLTGWNLSSDISTLNIGKSGNNATFNIDQPLNVNGALNIWAGNVNVNANVDTSASGNIVINAANLLLLQTGTSMSTFNGNIILNVGRFVNQGGASALSAGGSAKYWQIWSNNADPFNASTGDVRGGLVYNYKQYNAFYGATTAAQSGNGLLYSYAPAISATLSGSARKIYDGTNSAALDNLQLSNANGTNGDIISISAPTYAYFADAQAASDKNVYVGGYNVTAVDGVTAVPVYGYSTPDIMATIGEISKRSLSLTGLRSADKIYDGILQAQVLGAAVLGNIVGNDDVQLSGTPTAQFADANVADGIAVRFSGYTLTGSTADNYILDSHADVYQSITPRLLTLSGLGSANKIYDGHLNAQVLGTAMLGNIVGSDDVQLTGTASAQFADANVGDNIVVRFSGLSLTGAQAHNYELGTHADVYQSITRRLLTLSGLSSADKIYDGTLSAQVFGTAQLGNIVGNDDVQLTGAATAQFADANAGNTIAVSFSGLSLTGASAHNYDLGTHADALHSITRRLLTLSGLSSADKIYDGKLSAQVFGTAQLGNIVGNDDVQLTGTATAQFADANAGNTIAVSFSGLSLTGASAHNYDLGTHADALHSITRRLLTLSGLSSTDKIYDGTLNAQVFGTAQLSNIVGNDDVQLTGMATAQFADANAGNNIAVSFSGLSLTGAQAHNYDLGTHADGLHSITRRLLTLSGLSSADKIYDGTLNAQVFGAAQLGNIVGNDDVQLVGSALAQFSDKNASSRIAVQFTGLTLDGAKAGNYILGDHAVVYQAITPRLLRVTGLLSADKIYDGTRNAALLGEAVLNNHIISDDVRLTGTVIAQFADKNKGDAIAVHFSGLSLAGQDAGNYILADISDVTQAIRARLLTVSGLTSANKIYDGTTDAQIGGTAQFSNLIAGDDVMLGGQGRAYFNSAKVADAHFVRFEGFSLQGRDAGNYVMGEIAPVLAMIAPRPLYVDMLAGDKIYDGNDVARISLHDDRIAGDELSISYQAHYADRHVGSGKAIFIGNWALTGRDAGNYSLVAGSQFSGAILQRASVMWTGGVSQNYFDAGNWEDGALPDAHNVAHVVIGNGAYVRFTGDSSVMLNGISGAGHLLMASGLLQLGYEGLNLGGFSMEGGVLRTLGDLKVGQYFSQTGGIIWTAANVRLNHLRGDVMLGNIHVGGDFDVTTNDGAVGQHGGTTLDIGGTTHILGRAGGAPADIILAERGNIFAGPVILDGRSIAVASNHDLQLGGIIASADVTLATQNQAISQTGALLIGGRLRAEAGTGDIILMNPSNRFSGPVQLTGGMVQSNDASTRGLFRIAEMRPSMMHDELCGQAGAAATCAGN